MQTHVVTVSWSSHEDKLREIRDAVFHNEQGIDRDLDYDGQDAGATHILAMNEAGQAIGCARLLETGKIGRMAVLAHGRKQGIGSRLLAEAIAIAKDRGLGRVFLDAQLAAEAFYRKHGFVNAGTEFVEAGIVHQPMEVILPIAFEAPAEEIPKPAVREQPAPGESAKAALRHHRGESECLSGLLSTLGEPLRDLQIYSPHLDHFLFDAPQVVDALSAFVRRGAPAKLHVLIHTSSLIVGRGHRLLELARRMDSKIEIRRVPDELASDAHTYVTWDHRGYWLMPDYREYDGLSNLYDPVQANRLSERFEYLWHKSQIDPELRTLRL